jgi:hypothetical protein
MLKLPAAPPAADSILIFMLHYTATIRSHHHAFPISHMWSTNRPTMTQPTPPHTRLAKRSARLVSAGVLVVSSALAVLLPPAPAPVPDPPPAAFHTSGPGMG